MAEIERNQKEFYLLLEKLLLQFPQGFPKNELWNEFSRIGRTCTPKSLGVKKLGQVFELFPNVEEVNRSGKVYVRIKQNRRPSAANSMSDVRAETCGGSSLPRCNSSQALDSSAQKPPTKKEFNSAERGTPTGNREQFLSLLHNALQRFPTGLPKNEFWNKFCEGVQFTTRGLDVSKLSQAFDLYPGLEEVTDPSSGKVLIRLKQQHKEDVGKNPWSGSEADRRSGESVQNSSSSHLLGSSPQQPLGQSSTEMKSTTKGLLAGEFLGPAIRCGSSQRPQQLQQQNLNPPLPLRQIPIIPVPGYFGVQQPRQPRQQLVNNLPQMEWPKLGQGDAGISRKNRPQQIETQVFSGTSNRPDEGFLRPSESMESLQSTDLNQSSGQRGNSSRRQRRNETPLMSFGLPSGPARMSSSQGVHGTVEPHLRRQQQHTSSGSISREQVENVAKICIDQLSEAGEYVSPERVEKLLLNRLQKESISDLNLYRVKTITHLETIREFNRMACKVNTYCHAFVQVRSICTIYELEQNMLEFAPDKENFSSLKLGPIQKLPVVYDLFKFPPAVETVPEITSLDILQQLREYLTKENKWTAKIEMEDVMDYLVKQYDVPDAYHLGVRIRSLPLACQMLKKAQREAGNSRRSIVEKLKDELKRDVEGAVQKFRAAVLQPVTSDNGETCLEIRRHYLETTPENVIMEIFSKFQLLMSLESPESKSARKQHMKLVNAVSEFLMTVRGDQIASKLFHLSICVSALELQEMLQDVVNSEAEVSEEQSPGARAQPIKCPPPVGKLVEKLQHYLDRCLMHGSVTLEHMQKIEECLLRDFEFPCFQAMGLQSFLWFLLNQPEAKVLLEQNCGIALGSSGTHNASCSYQPTYTEILQVIKQAEGCGVTEVSKLEETLCSQYGVRDVCNLGYGMMDRLKKAASKSGKHQSKDSLVIYEATLCQNRNNFGGEQVGILGHQTKESARACLHNCPLLENLAEWSNWSLVFEPELGPLKEFVQKYGGLKQFEIEGGSKMVTTDFIAMETKPGLLIKLISQTSVEKFAAAVKQEDCEGTCGHLLSQIAANKGVAKTPLALLTNHVKAALFTLNAESVQNQTPGGPPQSARSKNKAVDFVLGCLYCLPMRICLDLASQVFLKPLGDVVGSRQSKTMLWNAAKNDEGYISRLFKLGGLLGIQEWTEPIEKRWQFPEEAVIMTGATGDVGEGEDELMEIVDEEEEALEEDSDSEFTVDSDSAETDEETTEEPSTTTSTNVEEETPETDQNVTSTVEEESSGETTSESESSDSTAGVCKDLIDQIRKEEFGIGVQLSEDGQKLMKVQQERLGRSLDRLSKDLYSKDTHFVLELVQNADDNTYPTEMENSKDLCPTVEFVIEADRVVVKNNECGFEERNIRALCDVGRSTKGKHKYGYIGQKGIGFKSVFRVTDSPEVHSNGFHIKFDVNSGPTGYILPHWVEDNETDNSWMTTIVLPFKKEVQNITFAARFNDIHPSLLLFLHRLRQISVINKIENRTLTMRRRDHGNNVVEIKHTDSTDHWLVVRKTLDASQISLQAKSGVEVESTEIALAFPMKPSGQKAMTQVLPPKQEVFAFLPLHSYGFRFIIQGDFDVPSSREDVDKDSAWNQWLRNEIPALFIEAFDNFKTHRDFSLMEAICNYLQFVPMEDEILDFFQPVASHIIQRLRGKNCVPTHPNSKDQVYMKKPSQVITTRDSLVKEVISPDMLHKHLNLFYLHGDLAALLNPSLTQTLGIETVTTQHLLQVGKTIALNLQSGGDADYESNVVMVAKWLACVYRSLDDLQSSSDVLTTLKSMSIIPLSSGQFTSLDSHTVFFPISKLSPAAGRSGSLDPFMLLQSDLFAVHPKLLSTPDNVINSQVQRILQQMGVKTLTPSEVIGHHIMPVLKSDAWKEKTRDLLITYIIYIKTQVDQNPNIVNFEELKQVVKISTNRGMKNPASEPIHFTPSYGNQVLLTQILPGYEWVLLDGVYLSVANQPGDAHKWRNFFSRLGVVDFLAVKEEKVHLTADTIDSSHWSALKDMWRPLPGGYVITDCCCEEFHKLVTENGHPQSYAQQMKILCELIDQRWDSVYSHYQSVPVCNTTGQEQFHTESSFSILLHTSSWLPGIYRKPLLKESEFDRLEETVTLSQPFLLYIRAPEIESLLQYTVPYIAADMSPKSSFGTFLRLKMQVDANMVKDLLIEWSQRESENKAAVFCTSLSHIKTVYKFLFDRLPLKEVQDLLHGNAVIFVPVKQTMNVDVATDDQKIVAGHMLKREEVWWSDPTYLFSRRRKSVEEFHADIACKRILEKIYYDMQEYFTGRSARIQFQPTATEYAQLWIHIANTEVLGRENSTLQDVLRLMAQIGFSLQAVNDDRNHTEKMIRKEDEKKMLRCIAGQKIFPTKQNVWVSVSQHPMISDSKPLEQLFQGQDNVYMLNLEEKSSADRKKNKARVKGFHEQRTQEAIFLLLSTCGITTLSASIHAMQVTEMSQPCPELQMYMHKVIPFLQLYLFTHYDDVYQNLVDKHTAERLQTMSLLQVGKLEVVYSLKHSPDTVVRQNEVCIYDYENNTFFFQQDHMQSYSDINGEIAKCFSEGDAECLKSLRSFLAELTAIFQMSGGDTEELMNRYEVSPELPDDETLWNVPQPVIQTYVQHVSLVSEEMTAEPKEGLSGNTAGSNEIRAWPPNSSLDSFDPNRAPKKGMEDRPTSNVWPPPKPPEYMDTKELPPGFQNLLPPTGNQEGPTRPDHGEGQRSTDDGENQRRSGDVTHQARPPQSAATTTETRPDASGEVTVVEQKLPGDELPRGPRPGGICPEGSSQSTRPKAGGESEPHVGERGESAGQVTEERQRRESSLGGKSLADSPVARKRTPSDEIATPSPKRPSLIMDSPLWDEMTMSDTLYEELGQGGNLQFPEDAELDQSGEIKEIGDWGERLVRNYLQHLQLSNPSIKYVIWSKETGNEANPYDFEVISETEQGQQSIFIEVKTTLSSSKEVFEISSQELRFAFDRKENYHIYRVYGAGNKDNVRLVRIRNVAFQVDKKNLRLCLVV